MCSHRLAAVLDELHSAVHLVLVNSSRAWSSSGGVVVINVRWRCAEPSPAYGGCATPRQCWTRTRDRWDRGRRWGQVMPAVGVHRAVCDPLTWWPSDACDYRVVRTSTVVRTRRAQRCTGAVPADDQA
jgi:hypothetical protein